jgi:hypothetical protein
MTVTWENFLSSYSVGVLGGTPELLFIHTHKILFTGIHRPYLVSEIHEILGVYTMILDKVDIFCSEKIYPFSKGIYDSKLFKNYFIIM